MNGDRIKQSKRNKEESDEAKFLERYLINDFNQTAADRQTDRQRRSMHAVM